MAVNLSKSVFFHIGRTGGYAVRSALQSAGLVVNELGAFHCIPADVVVEHNKATFAFVRHPMAWLRSLWYHKLLFGVDEGDHPLLHHISDVNPSTFVEYCIENFPEGLAYEYFKPYLNCRYIGRLEYLKTDLKFILKDCGEIAQGTDITLKRENESLHPAITEFKVGKFIFDKFMTTERHWCERLGYAEMPSVIGKSDFYSPLSDGWSNRLYREEEKPESCKFESEKLGPDSSAYHLGLAKRAGCQVDELVAEKVLRYDYNDYLRFSNVLRENQKHKRRDYENFVIAYKLRSLNPIGKSVLLVNCQNGFHAISAERFGALVVTAIDDEYQEFFSEFVIPFLASNILFHKLSISKVPEEWNQKFDLIVVRELQNLTDSPQIYFKKLFSLLKHDGHLIVDTEMVDVYPGIPLIFSPLSEFSPTGGLVYMNKEAIEHCVAKCGDYSVSWEAKLRIGLTDPSRFRELPFPGKDDYSHERTSIVCRALLDITRLQR